MSEAAIEKIQLVQAAGANIGQKSPDTSVKPEQQWCHYGCLDSVYCPGHEDKDCRSKCWLGCSFLPRRVAKAACVLFCVGACWVPPCQICIHQGWICDQ